jgi:hypothetical protein
MAKSGPGIMVSLNLPLSLKHSGSGDSTNDKLKNANIQEVIDKHGHGHHILA